MMKFNTLTTITPVDGRYYTKVKELSEYFSEYALIKYRILVEIEYFIALCELPLPQLQGFDPKLYDNLRSIYRDFTEDDAQKVKDIENVTNHDVKAVEYYIKEKMKSMQLDEYLEFVHFGLTSQDINNTAVPRSLSDAVNAVY
jgi:adenylosuccinate lyase